MSGLSSFLTLPPRGERGRHVLIYLALAVCAFVCNGYPVRLSNGADILTGSIFALLAAVLGGPWPALAVSLAGGLRSYLIWGHPWAIPLVLLEGLFVAMICRRDRTPVVAVILYWATIGIPLVWVVYRWRLGLGLDFVWMIGLADTLAGILGAIAVHILTTMGWLRGFLERRAFHVPSYSLQSHIWVSALLFGIVPLLILLEYAGGELARTREQESQVRLREAAESFDVSLRRALPEKARLTGVTGEDGGPLRVRWVGRDGRPGESVAEGVSTKVSSLPMLRLLCFAPDGRLLYTQPAANAPGPETQERILQGMAMAKGQRQIEFRRHHPVLTQAARYLGGSAPNPGNGYTIVATQPASFAGAESRSLRKVALVWLTATILVSLVLGSWFSVRVTLSLQNLVKAMQASLQADGVIGDCPPTANSEVRLLWRGFQLLQRKLAAAVEEHRVNARKAMEAVNEKSAFMAAVSHELRGPMSSIFSAAALMNTTGESDQPSIRPQEGVQMIARSSRHLISILDDIADFSRLEAHTMPIRTSAFVLPSALSDVMEWLEGEARRKQIEVGVELGADVPLVVVADRTRFSQILFNLMQNAVKFTDRGSVRLSVARTGTVADDGGVELELRVTDTGDGIPADLQQKVFEPFFHRSTSRATPRAGSGLGLAIVKRLVEHMGGSVAISSSPGWGTEVTVRLAVGCPEGGGKRPEGLGWRGVFAMGKSVARESLVSQWGNLGLESRTVIFDAGGDWRGLGCAGAVVFVDAEEMPTPEAERRALLGAAAAVGVAHLVVVEAYAGTGVEFGTARVGGMGVHTISWPPMLLKFEPVGQALAALTGGNGKDPGPAARKRLRVLIAEDNDDSRLLLQLALERFGHRVTAVGDGADVLPLLEAERFDAVLLDIEMPLLGGVELVGRLRKMPAYENLPVYAVTAHTSETSRAEFLATGFSGYLAKPYTMEALDVLLRGHDGGEAPPEESGVVDAKMFRQYATVISGGGYAVEPVVTGVLNEAREWVEGDPQFDESQQRQVHALVGSCSLIGARRLADHLRSLSHRTDGANWEADVAEARRLLEETEAWFAGALEEWRTPEGAGAGALRRAAAAASRS